jgi:predicted MPP superfamily phosphohydrolase
MLAGPFPEFCIAAILFVGACAGHTAFLTCQVNIMFGLAWPRKLLSVIRKLHALAVLAGPFLFWYILSPGPSRPWLQPYPEPSDYLLGGYTVLCWVFGFGVLPAFTAWRLLRPRPAALVGTFTETVDVAGLLGYKPIGHGKYQWAARLPLNQVFQVDFVERTFRLPRLPAAWDGLKVLHLSDLHFRGTPDREYYQYVLDRCRDWEPDLVALTGDIVDSHKHHRWMLPLLGRLAWKSAAVAILGNHDYWHTPALVRRRLRRLGMTVLPNTWEELEVRGEALVVIGHEGPWFRPAPALSGCPQGPFRLCLSHTPDNIRWARQNNVDLMLSGHNHGGQIRLPVLGSIFVPSRFGRRYDCGTFDEPPTVLYVSRGLAGQHPLRYNCRPEVTLLRLTSS